MNRKNILLKNKLLSCIYLINISIRTYFYVTCSEIENTTAFIDTNYEINIVENEHIYETTIEEENEKNYTNQQTSYDENLFINTYNKNQIDKKNLLSSDKNMQNKNFINLNDKDSMPSNFSFCWNIPEIIEIDQKEKIILPNSSDSQNFTHVYLNSNSMNNFDVDNFIKIYNDGNESQYSTSEAVNSLNSNSTYIILSEPVTIAGKINFISENIEDNTNFSESDSRLKLQKSQSISDLTEIPQNEILISDDQFLKPFYDQNRKNKLLKRRSDSSQLELGNIDKNKKLKKNNEKIESKFLSSLMKNILYYKNNDKCFRIYYLKKTIFNFIEETKSKMTNLAYNCCTNQSCQTILTTELTEKYNIFNESIPYIQKLSLVNSLVKTEANKEKLINHYKKKSNWLNKFRKNPAKYMIKMLKTLYDVEKQYILTKYINCLFSEERYEVAIQSLIYICLQNVYVIHNGLLSFIKIKHKFRNTLNFIEFKELIINPIRILDSKIFCDDYMIVSMNDFEKIFDLINISRYLTDNTDYDLDDNNVFDLYYNENIPTEYMEKIKKYRRCNKKIEMNTDVNNIIIEIICEHDEIFMHILCKYRNIMFNLKQNLYNYQYMLFYDNYNAIFKKFLYSFLEKYTKDEKEYESYKKNYKKMQKIVNSYFNCILIKFLSGNYLKNFTNIISLIIFRYSENLIKKVNYISENWNEATYKSEITKLIDIFDKIFCFFDFTMDFLAYYIKKSFSEFSLLEI